MVKLKKMKSMEMRVEMPERSPEKMTSEGMSLWMSLTDNEQGEF